MRFVLSALLPALLALAPTAISQTDLECPDGDLQTYLLALIDALYWNGLTAFEDFIVHLSETDEGYALLEAIYTAPYLTLIPPVDSAFQMAGLQAPYTNVGNGSLVDLLAYHTLQGDWGYEKLPPGPMKGVANSSLLFEGSQGSYKGQVLQQGDGGALSVRMAVGNSTSWSGPLDLSPYAVLDNLKIIPIDNVVPVPPKLTDALKLPTSTRSANGFSNFVQAFLPNGAAELEQAASTGGLTIFMPVDDAFDAASSGGVKESHYTTRQLLWSPDWSYPGQYSGLILDSGDKATVVYDGTGSYVSLEGGNSARILRSDIALDNGVMHIIDTVLTGPGGPKPVPVDGTSGTGSGGGAGGDGQNGLQPQPSGPVVVEGGNGARSRAVAFGPMAVALAAVLVTIAVL